MFFTPDLLTRRDSGFGLLWLAATLGSKTALKNLSKRSVMTANITQLCDLIAEPMEPLALRLSSNLMYGVVRVYKVKQDIFMTDVNSCVNALKKMVQEMQQHAMGGDDLLLVQPTARPHTVTIQQDPDSGHAMILDALFSGWDDTNDAEIMTESDEEFNPKAGQRKKLKAKPAKESLVETARQDVHVLNEHHDLLVSGSLEKSVEDAYGPGQFDLSSSQIAGGFVFDDNFLGASDGFDLVGGLGDELARELGWEMEPVVIATDMMDFHLPLEAQSGINRVPAFSTPKRMTHVTSAHSGNEEDQAMCTPLVEDRANSVASFARALLSQDLIQDEEMRQPLMDITNDKQPNNQFPGKRKRARFLLDARTELTDDELKVARVKYLESQKTFRKEVALKKMEKNASRIIDGLIWGVPHGLNTEPLIRFWQDSFKVQVQARTNNIEVHIDGERPKKRTRREAAYINSNERVDTAPHQSFDMDLAMDQGPDMVLFRGENEVLEGERRSSEEPGQGRRQSRGSSGARGSQFDIETETQDFLGSQKSMFPWDNAGASSSVGGHFFNDQVDFAQVDIRLRSGSLSRKGSPLSKGSSMHRMSQSGSLLAGIGGISPAIHGSRNFDPDPAINNNASDIEEETQRSDAALVTLEKNSFDFLEYAKMQHQANPSEELRFDAIVPPITSTRHVASAGFYHCLVLATKNLLKLRQKESYGSVAISIF